ncbi:YihY/virulence factor BrkB family protein [Algoriphagus namhaensis]
MLKRAWTILKRSSSSFFEDDVFTYAASISFYTMLSLPAFLLIVVSVGATLYEENRIQQELIGQISGLIGVDTAKQLEVMLSEASLKQDSTFFARVVGIGTLLVSSTSVFFSLQAAINKIWKIEGNDKKAWVSFILGRLVSLAMVISIGFILIVSLVIDSLLLIFRRNLRELLGEFSSLLVTVGSEIISFGIMVLIFSLMFKVLPDAKIKWKNVWVGGLITAVLFVVGKLLIGLYLGSSSLVSLYGASGSLVVLLVWTYYASLIFLFGTKITQIYTEMASEMPTESKVRIEVKTVEQEMPKSD